MFYLSQAERLWLGDGRVRHASVWFEAASWAEPPVVDLRRSASRNRLRTAVTFDGVAPASLVDGVVDVADLWSDEAALARERLRGMS